MAAAVETRRAIEAAHRAFAGWRANTADERARVLRRWYDLMLTAPGRPGAADDREQGKPLAESRGEIGYAASFIEWFAEEARRIYGETIPSPWPDARIVVTREPVGVCAAITPWNFPAAMITRKVAPGAGCRLHDRRQTCDADAAVGACHGGTRRARRRAGGRAQRRDRRCARDRRRTLHPIRSCAR